MRRFLTSFVLIGALSLISAGGASAAARHHESTVTFQITTEPSGTQMYFGKVTGGPTACWFRREVDVLQGGPGVTPSIVGVDATSSNGDWLVTFDAPQAGYYRAVAVRRTYERHGVRHVCDTAKSPRILNI